MPGQTAAMTPKERVIAAMRREPVDYTPCCPKFNPLSPEQRIGKRWQFPWGPTQIEMLYYCLEVLGVDMTVAIPAGSYVSAPGVSSQIRVEGDIIHKTYITPAGELHSSIRRDDRWPHGEDVPFFTDFSPGHATEHWLQDERDLECLRHIMMPPDVGQTVDRIRPAYDEARALAGRWNLPTIAHIGMGLTGALHLFGPTELCMMTVENPELVDEYLELEHQVNLKQIEIACELGVNIVRRNGFYETADFYGPVMLEQFLFDRLQREIALAHEGGAVTAYTVHTGVMPILDYLHRLNFHCLTDIDVGFKGVDLPAIRDSQQDTKSFWLGPSNTFHLYTDDPEDTRRAVRECFEVFGNTGLMLTATPSAHSIMPWENTEAMIDEWKKLRYG